MFAQFYLAAAEGFTSRSVSGRQTEDRFMRLSSNTEAPRTMDRELDTCLAKCSSYRFQATGLRVPMGVGIFC
jgi:hypothetical protein